MSLPQQFYKAQRTNLISQLLDNSIAIIPASKVVHRNHDTEYYYRQNSDLHFICGWPEDEAVAVLRKVGNTTEFILFCKTKNPNDAIWIGERQGIEGAQSEYGADAAYSICELHSKMPELLEGAERIYYPFSETQFATDIITWQQAVQQKIRRGKIAPCQLHDLALVLHPQRLVKTQDEIRLIEKAVEITAKGHIRAMRMAKPGMKEYELEAELLYEFYKNGSRSPAYPSIVGAGANACVLHYVKNDCEMKGSDLVLIDAGAEYHSYAADITRTFPVGGKFSKEQQALYELVLRAQNKGIDAAVVGNGFNAIQAAIVDEMVEGFIDLKLLVGDKTELIESKAYTKYYMHNSGHWLGLDVHDVGPYRSQDDWQKLEANMVLTIEPGIYITPNSGAAKKWHNIGIRIEDDILISAKGPINLSKDIPREIHEIERLVGHG